MILFCCCKVYFCIIQWSVANGKYIEHQYVYLQNIFEPKGNSPFCVTQQNSLFDANDFTFINAFICNSSQASGTTKNPHKKI